MIFKKKTRIAEHPLSKITKHIFFKFYYVLHGKLLKNLGMVKDGCHSGISKTYLGFYRL